MHIASLKVHRQRKYIRLPERWRATTPSTTILPHCPPTLIIVLRSHLLPSQGQDSDGLRKLREQFAVLIQSQHLHPDKAGSILQDLPIHPCHTIYAAPDITSATSLRASFRENDRFQFQCFKLPSRHMTIINNLLLEEAYLTSSIVYHSRESLKANLENYMKADIYGMKAIFDPQEKRHVFLTTLEKICRDLGSSVSCRRLLLNLVSRLMKVGCTCHPSLHLKLESGYWRFRG
jgi:hypothetical protein